MGGLFGASIKAASDAIGMATQAGINRRAATRAWKREQTAATTQWDRNVIGATTDHNRKVGINRRTRAFNTQEATTAYDRKVKFASTKMQRKVADLKRAGLNPMLAYMTPDGESGVGQASAGAMGGSPASAGKANAPLQAAANFQGLGGAVDSYYQNNALTAQTEMANSATDLNNAKAYSELEKAAGYRYDNSRKKQISDAINKARGWFDKTGVEKKADGAINSVLTPNKSKAHTFKPKPKSKKASKYLRMKRHPSSGSSMRKSR